MSERVGPAVTFGLLAAWAVHDAEELAAMGRFARTRIPELRERFPQVPMGAPPMPSRLWGKIWRAVESTAGREFAVAVGVMATVVAAAAADGQRTGGRSGFYQATLDGFGLHGLVHLAQAAATRGYTPGVATAPLVVVPFTLWARARLRRAGVLRPSGARGAARGLALAGAATVGAHLVARRLVRQ